MQTVNPIEYSTKELKAFLLELHESFGDSSNKDLAFKRFNSVFKSAIPKSKIWYHQRHHHDLSLICIFGPNLKDSVLNPNEFSLEFPEDNTLFVSSDVPELKLKPDLDQSVILIKTGKYGVFEFHIPVELNELFIETIPVIKKFGNFLQLISTLPENNGNLFKKSKKSYVLKKGIGETFFDSNLTGMVLVSNGLIIKSNKAFQEMMGYSAEEVIGISPYELISPSDRNYVRECFAPENLTSKKEVRIIHGMRHKNGHDFRAMVNVSLKYNKYNQPESYLVSIVNIEELITTQEKLKVSEDLYSTVYNNKLIGIISLDRNFHIIEANQFFKEKFADERQLIQGLSLKSLVDESNSNSLNNFIKALRSGDEQMVEFDTTFINASGQKFELKISLQATYSETEFSGAFAFLQDIKPLKEAQELLHKRWKILEAINSNSHSGIDIIQFPTKDLNPDEALLFKRNQRMASFIGDSTALFLDLASVLKISSKEQASGLSTEEAYEKYLSQLKKNKFVKHYWRIKNNSGDIIELNIIQQLIDLDEGYILVRILRDITLTKLKEKELAQERNKLNAILNSTPDGIFAIDKEFRIIAINDQAKENFKYLDGIDVSVGDSLSSYYEEDRIKGWNKNYFSKVFKGESVSYVGPLISKGGQIIHVDNKYTPVYDNEGKIYACLELSKDMTDVKLNELALIESETKYKNLIETAPTAILMADHQGRIQFASNQALSIHGMSKEEIIGKFAPDFIHPEDLNRVMELFYKILESGNEAQGKFRAIHKTGRELYIEGRARLIQLKENINSQILITYNDVTQRIKTEKELSQLQGSFDLLYKNTFDPIFVYDYGAEKPIDANTAALDLLGYTYDEIMEMNRFDIIPEYHPSNPGVNLHESVKNIKEVVMAGTKFSRNGILKNKKGEDIYCKISIIPSGRKPTEAFIVVNDKTKEIQNYNKLEAFSAQVEERKLIYESLIKNSFDGIDITRYDSYKGKLVNPSLLIRNNNLSKILGSKSELFNSVDSFIDFAPDRQPDGMTSEQKLKSIFRRLLIEKRVKEEIIFTSDGVNYRDIEINAALYNLDEQILIIRHFRDITQTKHQRRTIEKQIEILNHKNDELKKYIESNLQLENFAYIASHDLKAPLRTVSSFAHLLKSNAYDVLDEKGKSFLDIIYENSLNMQVLIDDLLEFAKINTQNLRNRQINPRKLLRIISNQLKTDIEETNAKLEVEDLPEGMIADESMITRLLQNLINNAIKFSLHTENPVIKINCEETEEFYKFSVQDNGIGISQENFEDIFKIFKKLHSDDQYKGTGLGLTICKRIVEKHNGKIWISSELNQGSTIYFTISKHLEIAG